MKFRDRVRHLSHFEMIEQYFPEKLISISKFAEGHPPVTSRQFREIFKPLVGDRTETGREVSPHDRAYTVSLLFHLYKFMLNGKKIFNLSENLCTLFEHMNILNRHVEPFRTEREKQGLTRAQVAFAVRRSMSHIQNVESGVTAPSRADAEALAALLGKQADALFSRIRDDGKKAA